VNSRRHPSANSNRPHSGTFLTEVQGRGRKCYAFSRAPTPPPLPRSPDQSDRLVRASPAILCVARDARRSRVGDTYQTRY